MSKLQFLHGDVYEFLVANETMLGIVACYFLTIILTHGYLSLASSFRVLYIQDSGFESVHASLSKAWLPFRMNFGPCPEPPQHIHNSASSLRLLLPWLLL